MYHVPGKYTGGEAATYSWTQTLHEIELRVPLPADLPAGAATCSFRGRGIDLAVMGADDVSVSGELVDALAVDDCLWVIDRDAGGATLVATMRKAAPKTWAKLFAADADPAEEPKLMDGLEGRAAPDGTKSKSKQEMLKDAKARAAAELTGPSQAKNHVVEGRADEALSLSAADVPPLSVLVVRGCEGCSISLAADLSLIKLQIEQCTRVTLQLAAKLLTETIEVWDSRECSLRLGSKASTVQVDGCDTLSLTYATAEYFDRVMHTGPRGLQLSFGDAPQLNETLHMDELVKAQPEGFTLDERTDQFITRRVGAADCLSTELVIRLCNDFPTTEREAKEFEERTRMHADKLDEVVDGMLGSSLGKSLTEAEVAQMKTMVAKQSDAASQAKQQAELTAEGRQKARVDFKKGEGNAAFKDGQYQQAAVHYTEALALDDKLHTIYSNRAACFLKLGRYQQAKEDALACIELEPAFAKGHFRLGLAQQALEYFGDACGAFGKVLELEPNNKDAASGLNMARMQAERKRRQEAGRG